MAQGEIYKVGLEFGDTSSGKLYHCGLYVLQQTAQGFNVDDIGAEVKAMWDTGHAAGNEVEAYYDDTTELQAVTLRKWDPLEPSIATYTTGLPLPGTATSESLAPSSATVVSLRTAKIGRSYRGRIYMPAMAESIVDQGALSSVEADQLAVAFAELFDAWRSIGLLGATIAEAVVYSKTLGTAERITHVKVDRRLRQQRRRELTPALYEQATV